MKTKIRSRRAVGFRVAPMYRRRHMSLVRYLSRKFAFWTAMFSLLAFVVGNQVGTHGLYAVVHAVFGDVDDTQIAYDGTVSPLRIPDYKKSNGQNFRAMTFDQIPSDVFLDLPKYDAGAVNRGEYAYVYSVGFMGSYGSGGDGDGSHPGVDISAPKGTPVFSVMKGLVVKAANDAGGFGQYVTIKTAFAPDPYHPGQTTRLYATYAHFSATMVSEGQIVEKGTKIGEVGATGDASGNHLHFQIGRDSTRDGKAVNHPSWPFTSSEANNAGLSFSRAIDTGLHQDRGYAENISPMVYVQMNPAPLTNIAIESSSQSSAKPRPVRKSPQQLALDRKNVRLAKRAAIAAAEPRITSTTVVVYNDEAVIPVAPMSVAPTPSAPVAPSPSGFSTLELDWDHDAKVGVSETLYMVAKDLDGNIVDSPSLKTDLYIRTEFGKAEIRPTQVSALDFRKGRARIQVTGFSPTVVLKVQPLGLVFDKDPLQFSQ